MDTLRWLKYGGEDTLRWSMPRERGGPGCGRVQKLAHIGGRI